VDDDPALLKSNDDVSDMKRTTEIRFVDFRLGKLEGKGQMCFNARGDSGIVPQIDVASETKEQFFLARRRDVP